MKLHEATRVALKLEAAAKQAIKERRPEATSLDRARVWHAVSQANPAGCDQGLVLLGALLEIYDAGYSAGTERTVSAERSAKAEALTRCRLAFEAALKHFDR